MNQHFSDIPTHLSFDCHVASLLAMTDKEWHFIGFFSGNSTPLALEIAKYVVRQGAHLYFLHFFAFF